MGALRWATCAGGARAGARQALWASAESRELGNLPTGMDRGVETHWAATCKVTGVTLRRTGSEDKTQKQARNRTLAGRVWSACSRLEVSSGPQQSPTGTSQLRKDKGHKQELGGWGPVGRHLTHRREPGLEAMCECRNRAVCLWVSWSPGGAERKRMCKEKLKLKRETWASAVTVLGSSRQTKVTKQGLENWTLSIECVPCRAMAEHAIILFPQVTAR